MMGHAFEGMNEIYLDKHARLLKLRRIRDKLDKYVFNGKTFDEAMKDGIYFDEIKHIDTALLKGFQS